MGISGCTACQAGGIEALQAYDRAYQARLNQEAALAVAAQTQPSAAAPPTSENRPIPGATVGSIINISA